MLYVFIHGLTGRVFKILPLKEAQDSGEEMYLGSYIESLARDMRGATETFPELKAMAPYISALNIIEYLTHNDFSQTVCKKEVFKILGLLNDIERRMGGKNDEQ